MTVCVPNRDENTGASRVMAECQTSRLDLSSTISVQTVDGEERHEDAPDPQLPVLLFHLAHGSHDFPLAVLEHPQDLPLGAVLHDQRVRPTPDLQPEMRLLRDGKL